MDVNSSDPFGCVRDETASSSPSESSSESTCFEEMGGFVEDASIVEPSPADVDSFEYSNERVSRASREAGSSNFDDRDLYSRKERGFRALLELWIPEGKRSVEGDGDRDGRLSRADKFDIEGAMGWVEKLDAT